MSITETAYEKALGILDACLHPMGIKASGLSDGYPQVWARDSMITLLGACLVEGERYRECFHHTLETLGQYQNRRGMVPNAVDTRNQSAGFGAIDAGLWYVMGHAIYQRAWNDDSLAKQHTVHVLRALEGLRYLDVQDNGLLVVPEAADWADLLANRGNVLYDNVLYYGAQKAALRVCGTITDNQSELLQEESERTLRAINLRLWITNQPQQEAALEKISGDWAADFRAMRGQMMLRQFYLPWVWFRCWGDYADTLGNCLAILCGVADREQTDSIISWMRSVGIDHPWPARALDPPLHPGDPNWRDYYRNFNLNRPNQYHNGGVWPFVGGFYVAALVAAGCQEEAEQALLKLAQANQQGKTREWEFNEWLHGVSGRPVGNPVQAWSGGMYIFAYHAVQQKKVPFFPGVRPNSPLWS